jgi:hypothetical protein
LDSYEVAADIERAAGPGARIVAARGPKRFDVLPLLVATDGAIAAFGHDRRRLRPNVVLGGVSGLAERTWPGRQVAIGDAVVVLADLRARCIVTTYDPDTVARDVGVLHGIRASFGGRRALNAWAGVPGTVAVGDHAELDARVRVAFPELGRFAAPRRGASGVARAGMPVAGPRREHEQQPRVAAGADLVALAGVEDREEARTAGHGLAAARDLDLAVDDEQVGALVDLVVLELLARRQVQRDGARLAAGGVEDDRVVRLDGEAAQVPGLHASDATRRPPPDATPRRRGRPSSCRACRRRRRGA